MASGILILAYPVLVYTLNELWQCAKEHRMLCTWNTHCILSIHRFTKVLNFLQIYVPVYTSVCVYTHTHTHIYIYIHICVCIYMCVCVCVCVCNASRT